MATMTMKRAKAAFGTRLPAVFDMPVEEITEYWNDLTATEQLVARGYAMGKSSKAIAQERGIALKTLDIHRQHVARKFGKTKTWGFGRIFFAAMILGLPFKQKS